MQCEEKQKLVTTKAAALADQLKAKSAALAEDIREKAKDIDPDVDTTGPDVWFSADVDIRWERVDFSLDLPQIQLVDQRWKLPLPQVTVKDQDIIFHTPSVRMKTVKTGEYPETVCHMVLKEVGFGVKIEVPECTVKWSPIYIDVPEPFSQEQRIRMGIPEFRMALTEIVLGIPVITMKTQQFALHLPQITVKNIKVEAAKAQEKGNALSAESKVRGEKLKQEFAENAKLELSLDVKDLFYCYEQQLIAQRNQAVTQFENGVNLLRSTITALAANNVPDDNASVTNAKASLAKLESDRQAFAKQIEQSIRDLHAQQQNFFEKLIGEAPAEGGEQVA